LAANISMNRHDSKTHQLTSLSFTVLTFKHEQNKFTYQVVWSPRLRHLVFVIRKLAVAVGRNLVYFT